MKTVTYDDFAQLELRVGKVVRAEEFPKARKPAYKMWIDFGELGIKKSRCPNYKTLSGGGTYRPPGNCGYEFPSPANC